ncbi:MAG TPA: hypothetical protein PLK83_08190, partial [Limnochordia bacterium]|nr:hypothetical protein [Limnochordia bacterium]
EPPAAAGEGDAVSLERKIKSVRLRAYVIVVVAAAAVFFATNYLLIQAIRGYFLGCWKRNRSTMPRITPTV